MERQRKHWLNAQQKNDIWKMWRAGESLSAIARMLGRHPSGMLTVYAQVEKSGAQWNVHKARVSRSARRLMIGEVFTGD
ncbi:helix-turn-helix domain-containing protein [Paraburkholderia sp. ZP32-5]|uniref:helix-turn-helix domain-containing protein n=1 Tax=Paraburkholderia sp. ZP32-5 TaxID=2883245 RepID=UPI001F1CE637|nr:helix-turn-helix domain-containing protein [Paraburkholderia sp. ZP32-5]